MRKALLFLALALGLALPAMAQTTATFAYQYDLQATSLTYCTTAPEQQGLGLITTSGSNVITTGVSGTPFSLLAVGDDIWATASGSKLRRKVATFTSASQVSVNSAWTLTSTGSKWSYAHRTCGTAATDGWLAAANLQNKAVVLNFITLTGTGGVDVSVECRADGDGGAVPIRIVPLLNYTSATAPVNGDWIMVPEPCSSVRVGLAWHTANVGTDSISAFLTGSPIPNGN